MFNRGVPAFYNPKLDNPSAEENYLLKKRIRLMDKLKSIEGRSEPHTAHIRRILERRLRTVEAKLGIKP